jgi:lipopolysaccharide biosynthesis glycosyltransferase
MNLKKLRDMDFYNILKQEVMTGLQFELVDQDILNRVFENNYLRLDKTWNHQPIKADEIYQNDHILHISGLRPWESVHKPYADIWWNIAEKTPFFKKLQVKAQEARSRYLEQLEFKYFEMFNTTCWKITKPLRIMAALLQNLK